MPPVDRPVPWVPVWIAPAAVCTSISPILASDRPCLSSAALSLASGQPASTVTRSAASSIGLIPVSPSGRSSTPSVGTVGVNEWPLPVIRIAMPSAAARRTSSATSAADCGLRTRTGATVTLPAQFCQRPAPGAATGRADLGRPGVLLGVGSSLGALVWLVIGHCPPSAGTAGLARSGADTGQFCRFASWLGPEPAQSSQADQHG